MKRLSLVLLTAVLASCGQDLPTSPLPVPPGTALAKPPANTGLSLKPSAWTLWTGGGAAASVKSDSAGSLTVDFPSGPGTINYLFTDQRAVPSTISQYIRATFAVTSAGLPVFHFDDSQPTFCTMPPFVDILLWA